MLNKTFKNVDSSREKLTSDVFDFDYVRNMNGNNTDLTGRTNTKISELFSLHVIHSEALRRCKVLEWKYVTSTDD